MLYFLFLPRLRLITSPLVYCSFVLLVLSFAIYFFSSVFEFSCLFFEVLIFLRILREIHAFVYPSPKQHFIACWSHFQFVVRSTDHAVPFFRVFFTPTIAFVTR